MSDTGNPRARTLSGIFLAGLIAALPLAATVLVVVWVLRLLFDYVGPGSFIGQLLVALGLRGAGSEVVGYLIGVAIVLLAIFALGLLVQTKLRNWLGRTTNALVQRIPVVRNIYSLVERFVGLLSTRETGGLQSMRPVWCHFGGPGGVAVLGLLSCAEPILLNGALFHAVLLPTSPVPVGGGLLYVPQAWVTPAEIGIEALTSIYVSMGVTSTQHLPTASSVA
ncbi:MAG: DUF502 domain-containing protein [Methylibium sp.]|uniref:DUF502 domain-containing protein n=1 Tax=Methylibium sp. TaxID=2067992 RepID=UPI0017F2F860|nr:DUF502 domain-containing protein [Methylibium sp.]MBA2723291.1 DUF502 domain-containing protein [Methylibium sp.]MBA3588395.1 DUF502 domain-containing protein [Methylibium sp.]